VNLIRGRQRSKGLPKGQRIAVRRKKTRETAARYVHYEQDKSRLKVIMPTGGCRVPTCTFCMLPSLARSKSSVEEILASIARAHRSAPVRQLTIYTDGSFFDRRELNPDERRLIAKAARDMGAEELLVESLPRFLNAAVVDEVAGQLGPSCRLRLGVGVQSTNALVRQHITRTPIEQQELNALLKWRKTAPFSLRLYLLANKPMLSHLEDRVDLLRSLAFLNEWLSPNDTVTINPLLPTNGTLVEKMLSAGLWRPLRADEAQALSHDLQSRSYGFRIEFGPSSLSTCTDQGAGVVGRENAHASALIEAARLPWSILGSLRHRGHWATRGGLHLQ
jgi:radical SAM enzyme (TIGR01210 family)